LGQRWTLEAEYYQLLASQLQGQTAGLASGYETLRQKAGTDYPGIANQCGLQLGRLKFVSSDYAGAVQLFDTIIDSRLSTGIDVVAGAYNGRGRCRFELAQTTLSSGASLEAPEVQAAYQDALLDFLRVHVHYPAIQAEQAESFYWAARCLQNLTSIPEHERKARGLLKRCRDEHPSSPWAEKAASS
jgi:hypothetical protein